MGILFSLFLIASGIIIYKRGYQDRAFQKVCGGLIFYAFLDFFTLGFLLKEINLDLAIFVTAVIQALIALFLTRNWAEAFAHHRRQEIFGVILMWIFFFAACFGVLNAGVSLVWSFGKTSILLEKIFSQTVLISLLLTLLKGIGYIALFVFSLVFQNRRA